MGYCSVVDFYFFNRNWWRDSDFKIVLYCIYDGDLIIFFFICKINKEKLGMFKVLILFLLGGV